MLNSDLHHYSTRSSNHFHLPKRSTELGKSGITFRGAKVWNAILTSGIEFRVTEAIFAKNLKKIINDMQI